MRRSRLLSAAVAGLGLAAGTTGAAYAAFPYAPGGNPADPTSYKVPLGANKAPTDLQGKLEWMYAATPEPNNPVNSDPRELGGIRGAHVVDNADVDTAWRTTTGRPDVTIAVLDSGIEWDNEDAMEDLRRKTRLNKGELEKPRNSRRFALEGEKPCRDYGDDWDANGDGVFDVTDYACDPRVEKSGADRAAGSPAEPEGNGVDDVLDPQDVLIAFTIAQPGDDDGNGFEDDIVGWDFLDDDNDPYDDVQYGHGTGEARDSGAEADNGGDLGTCPNCTVIHMRVGDSFIADESRFAQATIYAVDNGALVVQEALGTLNHTQLATSAVKYAYNHGVAVIASAADEAAQHHNWPSNQPHVIVVNSVTKYDEFTAQPSSYLQFNGCTNFMSKITVAIPSVSCSSDATGRGSGMAGLIYSAALNRIDGGDMDPHPRCDRSEQAERFELPSGGDCPLSANEVRQLMASGTVGGQEQADDVNFATTELSCQPPPLDPCTDPNLNSGPFITRPVAPFPATFRYPAREGHDQFYGYGRVNMNKAVDAAAGGNIPPEAEITAPEWHQFVDPESERFDVSGQVGPRSGTYSCRLAVAPGSQPNNDLDFKSIASGFCDGSTRSSPHTGVLGTIDVEALRESFPPSAGNFRGREPGALPTGQTSNGRPNSEPYGFTIRVVVTAGEGQGTMRGEDRRNLYLHRDQDLLPGWPRRLPSDGESSPVFADLDADNRNEMILGTADGTVHAYRPDGSEAPGWPRRGDPLRLHTGGRAFEGGEVSPDSSHGAIIASPAVIDMDRDGSPEVVAADLEGKVYAWSAGGRRLWTRRTNLDFSGRPLTPFTPEREGKRNRTQQGFIASPVAADLDGDNRLEVVAAAMDRHLYAWHADGSEADGFPMIVVDPTKVESIEGRSHRVDFNANAGEELNQGAIIDTPAVGDLTGDGRPEIVVGTNEEYLTGAPGEEGLNAGGVDATLLGQLGGVAGLDTANSRLYAVRSTGDPDGNLLSGPSPFLPNWPVKIGRLAAELLPIVGEGITGNPMIGPAECGQGPKVGAMPDAGFGYLLNPDGSSCLGESGGKPRVLATTPPQNPGNQDTPAFAAVGHPAFGRLGGDEVSFLAPAAGLRRALDLAVKEYQQGSQDFLAAWNTQNGNFRTGFPARVNDLQFLTGPSVANIDGDAEEEAVGGTASLDLQAFDGTGQPASDRWPKFTSDWMVANPAIGSFGVKETADDARQSVVAVTRSGVILPYRTSADACSAGSWPRFHHDNANSGDFRRDAVAPGKPENVRASGGRISFTAVGDDLLCGEPARYELLPGGSAAAARGASFRRAAARPRQAGQTQSLPLPSGATGTVRVRAVDEQGNVGPAATVAVAGQQAQAPTGGGGGGQPTEDPDDTGDDDDRDDRRPTIGANERGPGDGGSLPFTGLVVGALALLGAALVAGGRWARRRAGGGPT